MALLQCTDPLRHLPLGGEMRKVCVRVCVCVYVCVPVCIYMSSVPMEARRL
jgi:hypothetical protein